MPLLYYNGDARASFVWEEPGVSGGNPRGRAGDDLIFARTTPEIEPGSRW